FFFNYKVGGNIVATIETLSTTCSIIVKCYKDKFATLQTMQEASAFSKEMSLFLELIIAKKNNILILGQNNSLKTTLLSALAKRIPGNDAGFVLDFTNELKIEAQNIINYSIDNEDPKSTKLIDFVFSSNPDRIFLNDPATDLVQKQLKKGYKGLVTTYLSNSVKEASTKLEHISKFFDFIIITELSNSIRKINTIYWCENEKFIPIFKFENSRFISCGNIPTFLKVEKSPFNLNIFNIDYKHTSFNLTKDRVEKPNVNILNKLKRKVQILQDNEARAE
ncbi:Flp pilus assembly complex ATPase component TadA, partial [bacterium]|nr:Flp pilus assembly complex ATPase component TadA [bacterium]